METRDLTARVIGCAFNVHRQLGAGFLERVYESALRIELEEASLSVQQQFPITVYYRGQPVGDYYADLLVEKRLLVEIKAVCELVKEHEIQLVNYLTATGIDDGLPLNFGSSVIVKHKYRASKVGANSRLVSPANPVDPV